MKNPLSVTIALCIPLALISCKSEDKTEPKKEVAPTATKAAAVTPAPAKPHTPDEPAPAAAENTADVPMIAAGELPLAVDFEDEAEDEITEANYQDTLSVLENEVAGSSDAP